MKRLKRLTTFVLAVIFTFALSVNVFAATVADGDYAIGCTMEGGTHGRTITSATLHVSGGNLTADIQIDSVNYTWMSVAGVTFNNDNPGGYSTFNGIPVSALDTPIAVSAETVAMSEPHVIDYTLTFASSSLPAGVITEDAAPVQEETTAAQEETTTVEETTEEQTFVIKGEVSEDGDTMTIVSANGKTYVIENGMLYEINEAGERVKLTDNLKNVSLFDLENNKFELKDGKFMSGAKDIKTTALDNSNESKSKAPVIIAIVIIAAAVVVCIVVIILRKKNKASNGINSSVDDNNTNAADGNDDEQE